MEKKPNIVFIFTDQQNAAMLGCAGNKNLNTPAMDYIAANGVRFDRAYCTNPVCLPSRFSLLTGRMPSYAGIRSNNWQAESNGIPEDIFTCGIGNLLKKEGYNAVYGGKTHLPGFGPEKLGFDVISGDERQGLSDCCSEYIRNYDDGNPFFMVASFINPHDICFMAIQDYYGKMDPDAHPEEFKENILSWLGRESGQQFKNEKEKDMFIEKIREKMDSAGAKASFEDAKTLESVLRGKDIYEPGRFYDEICPPLPDNLEPQEDEPEAIGIMLDQRPFRRNARENYDDNRWKLHRWAYCRLTEMVDSQIMGLIDAIKDSGKEEDTVVIFSSDHGDHDGAHRLEHKDTFYEESCRVPFMIMQKNKTRKGYVDRTHLISNGLDLIPTICDYAGINHPGTDPEGKSIRPLAEGTETGRNTEVLKIESEFGRGIIKGDYKYAVYFEGKSKEQLYDLKNDPGEMRNALHDKHKSNIVKEMREEFERIFR